MSAYQLVSQGSPHLIPDALSPPPLPPRARAGLVTCHLLFSTIGVFGISRLRYHGTHLLLRLPLVENILVVAAVGVWRVGGGWGDGALKGALDDVKSARWDDWLIAACISASGILRIYEARWLHVTTWSAVEVLLLAVLTSEPYITFPSPSTLFSSAILLPTVTGILLLVSTSANLGGVVLSILRVLALGAVWSQLRGRIGETRDSERIQSAASRLAIFSFILCSGFYAILTTFHLHTTPLSHTPSYDVLAFVVLPLAGASLFLTTIKIVASAPITATYTSFALPLRNLIVFILGAWVGQGGARSHRLRYWLAAVYAVALIGVGWVSTLPQGVRLPSNDFSTSLRKFLRYLPYVPFVAWVVSLTLSSSVSPCFLLGDFCGSTSALFVSPSARPSLDIVIAHYERPLAEVKTLIRTLKGNPFAKGREVRVIVYNKGTTAKQDIWDGLALNPYRDEVVDLENRGREGGTILRHILSRYNATATALPTSTPTSSYTPSFLPIIADHTLFIQSRLGWDWIAHRRLDLLLPETGYVSLGPYRVNRCGFERGQDLTGMEAIWKVVRGKSCDKKQVASLSGQFVASRRRVLNVTYEAYRKLDDMLEASEAAPLNQEHWGASHPAGPSSNPTFENAVEHSWPLIFGCDDHKMAKRCGDQTWKVAECQCLDEEAA